MTSTSPEVELLDAVERELRSLPSIEDLRSQDSGEEQRTVVAGIRQDIKMLDTICDQLVQHDDRLQSQRHMALIDAEQLYDDFDEVIDGVRDKFRAAGVQHAAVVAKQAAVRMVWVGRGLRAVPIIAVMVLLVVGGFIEELSAGWTLLFGLTWFVLNMVATAIATNYVKEKRGKQAVLGIGGSVGALVLTGLVAPFAVSLLVIVAILAAIVGAVALVFFILFN